MVNEKGDEAEDVTKEKAEEMMYAAEGRYFVVDEKTEKVLKECKLEDGMKLMFIPVARGG